MITLCLLSFLFTSDVEKYFLTTPVCTIYTDTLGNTYLNKNISLDSCSASVYINLPDSFSYADTSGWALASPDLRDKLPLMDITPSQINTASYDAFGFLDQFNDGDLVLVYREGTGHVDTTGKLVMRTSKDGGANWTSATTIYNSEWDDRNVTGGVTRKDNRLVVFFMKYKVPDSTMGQGYIYSDDKGANWSDYQAIDRASADSFCTPYGKMTEIGNDSLLMFWVKTKPNHILYALFSGDDGKTWGDSVRIFSNPDTCYWDEPCVAYLGGGNIAGVSRSRTSVNKDTCFMQFKSEDNGATWTNQGYTNFEGDKLVSPWLEVIWSQGEPIVFCAYGNRTDSCMYYRTAKGNELLDSTLVWSERVLIDSNRSLPSHYLIAYPSIVFPRDDFMGFGVWCKTTNDNDVDMQFFNINLYPDTILYADTTGYADKLDGYHGSYFVDTSATSQNKTGVMAFRDTLWVHKESDSTGYFWEKCDSDSTIKFKALFW